MSDLAIFLAFLVWLAAFGPEVVARVANFMAGVERSMKKAPKSEDSTVWTTSAAWWEDNYGPVKLWGYGGRLYRDIAPEELDAEVLGDTADEVR